MIIAVASDTPSDSDRAMPGDAAGCGKPALKGEEHGPGEEQKAVK